MTLNPDKESEEKVMRKVTSIRWAIMLVAFCLLLIPNAGSAQQENVKETTNKEQKPVAAYRLEFNIRELENGKRLNSRNYMMMAREGDTGKIRIENNVPYPTGTTVNGSPQWQYHGVGMNIDCRPRQQEIGVALDIVVRFSSVAPQPASASISSPVLHSDETDVQTVVAFGKPTLVTSLDDVDSNRRYEIEVTATKVK